MELLNYLGYLKIVLYFLLQVHLVDYSNGKNYTTS